MSFFKIHLFREVALRSWEGPLAAPGAILIPRIHHCFDSSGLKSHLPKWDHASSPKDVVWCCNPLPSILSCMCIFLQNTIEYNRIQQNTIECNTLVGRDLQQPSGLSKSKTTLLRPVFKCLLNSDSFGSWTTSLESLLQSYSKPHSWERDVS